MGILVLQAATCDEITLIDQRLDNGFVGVTLVALLGDDPLALKARGFLGVDAVIVDGEGDAGVDFAIRQILAIRHPDFKILAAMGWGSVDKACTCIISDVIAIEEGNGEAIILLSRQGQVSKRVGANDCSNYIIDASRAIGPE